MCERRGRHGSQPGYPVRDLSYVVERGGRTRRHKYVRDMRAFLWPMLGAILLQAIVYTLVITRPGRSDWYNIAMAIAALACVPALTAAVLAAFRRHGSPIIASSIVSIGLFSMAVSVLSALRIPLSYQGLAACLPIAVGVLAYANIAFHRSIDSRVALAAFRRLDGLPVELQTIRVIAGPDADISDIEMLLIDPQEHHSEKWSALLAECYLGGVEIMPWTRYLEVRRGRLDVASFDISHLTYSPSQLLYARVKRILDVSAVLLTLPLTLPIALLVAGYIALRDGFPVIFVQLRRGYGGKVFRMYKFRTMYKGSGGGATSLGDNRIIPGCALVRKLRLDELPQFYNILRGDMSLIGPRPEAMDLVKQYERLIPKYTLRLLVLPGITGWAQVNSGYTGNHEEAKVKLSYDLYYIKHLSFDLDLLVLFKTVKTVLFGSGAR